MHDLTVDVRRLQPSGWAATVSDVGTGRTLGTVNVRRWPNGREHVQFVRGPVSVEPAALAAVALALRALPSDASYAEALERAETALERALTERG